MTQSAAVVNPSLRNYRIHGLRRCAIERVIFATPTTASARSGRNLRASARSIRWRRPSPMPCANATGVRFAHLPLTRSWIFAGSWRGLR